MSLLECLMPENALVLRVMEATGMRITDCLQITRNEFFGMVGRGGAHSYTYKEQKTGKLRTVWIEPGLLSELVERPDRGSPWLFPGRDPAKHRTRQAVWKDLHRTAKLWRVRGNRLKGVIGTHTARKVYAVELYRRKALQGKLDPLACVKADLNHSDSAVTFLYAMADEISNSKNRQKSS